jgi:hypothetical protein
MATKNLTDGSLSLRIQKTQKRFKKIKNPDGPDIGVGYFLLEFDVTAVAKELYIPLSIASGKKPTGFVYQIEGTAKGAISTAEVTVRGDAVTQVTMGTILYAKIPAGTKAAFRMLIEIRGKMQNGYRIVINTINYKTDMNAARYQKFQETFGTETLKLS